MKTGDIVQVFNGTWSLLLIKGEIKPVSGYLLQGRIFRVLATDGKYPTNNPASHILPPPPRPNDTMVLDVTDTNFVLFTRKEFCRVTISSAERTATEYAAVVAGLGMSEIYKVQVPCGTTKVILEL